MKKKRNLEIFLYLLILKINILSLDLSSLFQMLTLHMFLILKLKEIKGLKKNKERYHLDPFQKFKLLILYVISQIILLKFGLALLHLTKLIQQDHPLIYSLTITMPLLRDKTHLKYNPIQFKTISLDPKIFKFYLLILLRQFLQLPK